MPSVCAFTGHREQAFTFCGSPLHPDLRRLISTLEEEIRRAADDGVRHFISGFALGVDLLAAEIVLKLKKEGLPLTLEAAIPCPRQAAYWRAADRRRYDRLLEQADVKTLVSPTYTRWCMHVRNRYMVEKCDLLLAVFGGVPGGTARTLSLARSAGKEVRIIDCSHILQASAAEPPSVQTDW